MARTRDLRRGFAAGTTTEDPDEVWRRWTEPATWGSWDRGLDGRHSTFMVREVVPRQRAVIEVPLPGAAMTLTRTLGPGTPAPVEHLVTSTGPLGRLWSGLLGRRFRPLLGPTVDAVAGVRDEATS